MTQKLTKTEKILGWVYLLLQMLVLPVLVTIVFAAAAILSGRADLFPQADTAVNLICFYLNAALALVFFRRLLTDSWHSAQTDWKHTLLTAAQGFGLYWLINLAVSTLIFTLRPDFGNVNDANVSGMISESPVLMTLAVIFAAPLAEECLFRGWMFQGLAEKSLPLAYIVTCGFFSAAHIISYIGIYDPVTLGLCFLQYLGPSIALCHTCRRGGGLMAPLLLHMLVNALGCLLM